MYGISQASPWTTVQAHILLVRIPHVGGGFLSESPSCSASSIMTWKTSQPDSGLSIRT